MEQGDGCRTEMVGDGGEVVVSFCILGRTVKVVPVVSVVVGPGGMQIRLDL